MGINLDSSLFWHPLLDERVEIIYLLCPVPYSMSASFPVAKYCNSKRTSICCTFSKSFTELTESKAVGFVWKESLVLKSSCDYGWGKKSCGSSRPRVHAPEALLNAFQRPRHWGCSQVYHIRIANDGWHIVKLMDVEMAKTFSKCQRRLSALVGQFTQVTKRSLSKIC